MRTAARVVRTLRVRPHDVWTLDVAQMDGNN